VKPKPLQRLLSSLGLTTKAETEQRATRAYESGYADGNDDPADATTGIAAGGFGYRRISASAREGGISWEDNLSTVWALFQSNPLANRYTELKRDYIAGGAHEIQHGATDDNLGEILDGFWDANKLDEHVPEFALQLFLFGGQCFPVFVRQSDGAVRLGYLDPSEIIEVIPHPDNSMEMWAVVGGPTYNARPWETSSGKRVYRIIREDEGAVIELRVNAQRQGEALRCDLCGGLSHLDREYCEYCNAPLIERYAEAIKIPAKHEGLLVTAEQAVLEPWEARMLKSFGLDEYTGSCFYYRANHVSNQALGYGDLLSVADFLDQWDGTLFALGERELFRDFFGFDVTMEGANDTALRARSQALRKDPPARGQALVHNEKEMWNIFAPDLGQPGSIATSQEQKGDILGSLGIPLAWFGAPGGTHLATAQSQGDPTWRSLRHAQGMIQTMIEEFLNFARDQAIIAGTLPADIDGEITVTMPEMSAKDLGIIAGVLSAVASALLVAQDAGWIDATEGQEVFRKMLSELGVDLEMPEEGALSPPDDAEGDENLRIWKQSYFNKQPVIE
jgi:hypothetical protein